MKTINESWEDLVIEYINLPSTVVYKKFSRFIINLHGDDLIQAGTIGLIQAAKSFDPDKKVKFKDFAFLRIHGEMQDYLRLQVHGSKRKKEFRFKVCNLESAFANESEGDHDFIDYSSKIKDSKFSLQEKEAQLKKDWEEEVYNLIYNNLFSIIESDPDKLSKYDPTNLDRYKQALFNKYGKLMPVKEAGAPVNINDKYFPVILGNLRKKGIDIIQEVEFLLKCFLSNKNECYLSGKQLANTNTRKY